MKHIYRSTSVEETEAIGATLSQSGITGIIALYGDLGSGKTAFCRGFVHATLADAPVTSPTYTVINAYGDGAKAIFHLDLYRIADEDDLMSVGFSDIPEGVPVLCEWAEHLPTDFSPQMRVSFRRVSDTEREITVEDTEC